VRRDKVPVLRDLAHMIWHARSPGIITVEQIDYMLAGAVGTATFILCVNKSNARAIRAYGGTGS